MASNFRIIHHRNSDCLHLKLTGDMDGNSAYEIINLLDDNSNKIKEAEDYFQKVLDMEPYNEDAKENLMQLRAQKIAKETL